MKRKTHNEFVEEIKKLNKNILIHNDSIEYFNNRTRMKFMCKICGHIWDTKAVKIINGCSCPKCANNIKKTHNEFEEQLKNLNKNISIHNESIKYVNNRTYMKFICNTCGYEWKSKPNDILSGYGCAKCSKKLKYTTEEFKKITNKFNIDVIGEYINNKTNIKVRCNICNYTWDIRPNNLLNSKSCPNCREHSIGETFILEYLNNNHIKYELQKKFKECKDKRNLKFDFYLPEYNTCIEFDGEQHYERFKFEKDDSNLKKRKKRDNIKNKYCKENNIKLIRIPYWKKYDINSILDNNFYI